jgi:ABC-type transport system substrate-binding protein
MTSSGVIAAQAARHALKLHGPREPGRADWTFDGIPPAQLQTLVTRNASQLHINPGLIFEFLPLNTHRAPFDDLRVRRALNYAIDRGKIARMYGGPTVATPSCQPLAPRIPGYKRYCPYTRDPRPSGAWSGPDLARARALVAASGRRGARVDVWGTTNVCDRALDQQMRAATVAQLARPRRAAALWTAVDHKLVDEAMWVPTVTLNAVELVSKRLAGYQFNPVTGFLADQAWLR